MAKRTCSVGGCGKPHSARGFCKAHAHKHRRYGDPLWEQSWLPLEERFWSKVDRSGECWLWTAVRGPSGYGEFQLRKGRKVRAPRLAWELTYGRTIPEGLQIRHACDNPPCVRPDHLSVGTAAENSQDRVERDRQTRGERHWHAILTPDQVLEIRRRRAGGEQSRSLAAEFGVTIYAVRDVVARRSWRHLP